MPAENVAQILVVDDEPEIRKLLADALNSDDMEVRTAATGDEATMLAQVAHPDLLITDLRLEDCTGVDVIDRVRSMLGDVPTVVITGISDKSIMKEAALRNPLEFMTKPLDLQRLTRTIRQELARQAKFRRLQDRTTRIRRIAKDINKDRKSLQRQLETTCSDLTQAYRNLSRQMGLQQIAIDYHQDLLTCKNDDDVFRSLFKLWVHRSGSVFGVALACNSEARLQMIGRFGVPQPDSTSFCEKLAEPVINCVLTTPRCMLMDAGDRAQDFDASVRRYLPGLSILGIPLMPKDAEMIGLIILYRKGEQPFTDEDVALAQMLSLPTALAVERND